MKRTPLTRHTRLTQGRALKLAGRLPPVNRKRRAKRFALNYGTSERVQWFHEQPCACKGKHPECGGPKNASHTVSKAHLGDASTVITQTQGCHDYIGTQGWDTWEREVAALLGMHAPFVVEGELGYRLDRHALAADFATRGPDAPKGEA